MNIVKTKKQRSSHLASQMSCESKVVSSGCWWWYSLIPSGARDIQHQARRDVTISLNKFFVGAVIKIVKTKKTKVVSPCESDRLQVRLVASQTGCKSDWL